MPNDAIDTIFAELNATLDNALVPPTMKAPPEHTLLNWNVVTAGAKQVRKLLWAEGRGARPSIRHSV